MSPIDSLDDHQNEPLDTRLRIDPNKVAAARAYLAEIDATVFQTAEEHPADNHALVLGSAIAALFGRE